MTHFLEVSALRDGLQEVLEHAVWLRRLLAMTPEQRAALEQARTQQGELTSYSDDVRSALTGILEQSESMLAFLDQFESAPIIYTGEGTTNEVLALLERLIARRGEPGGEA